MRTVEATEPFPFRCICHQVIKFFLVCPVGFLDLSVELWRSKLYIDMACPYVFDMLMTLGLKLMASVCSYHMDADGEFLYHTVNKLDDILLNAARVDFHRPDPGGIINSHVSDASDSVAANIPQGDKFRFNLDVITQNFFGIASSMNSTAESCF